MNNIIYKTLTNFYRFDYLKWGFSDPSQRPNIPAAVKAVIDKEGPEGIHLWQLLVPPLRDRKNDHWLWQVYEQLFCRALSVLSKGYEEWAKEHADTNESECLKVPEPNVKGRTLDFYPFDYRRWVKVSDDTMAFDFTLSDYALDYHSPAVHHHCHDGYEDYDFRLYPVDTSCWFNSTLVRSALYENITPAMSMYLRECWQSESWPVDALTDREEVFLEKHPEAKEYYPDYWGMVS